MAAAVCCGLLFMLTNLCSELICKDCQCKLTDTYLFIQNTQRSTEIIEDCIHQIEKEVEAIEPAIKPDVNYSNIVINLKDLKDNQDQFYESEVNRESDGLYINDNENFMLEYDKSLDIKEAKTLSCDHCGLQFQSKQGIACHMNALHKKHYPGEKVKAKLNSKEIRCPECKETNCVHKKYLISYKQQSKLSGMIKCIDCEYVCTKRRFLLSHVNLHHLKKFNCICEQCGKAFHSKMSYRAHIRSFHTVLHSCLYCDIKYRNMLMLKTHEKLCEKEKREYQCDQCPASFSGKNKLAYHKKKHGQQYPCKMCYKVFTEKRIFHQHILNHSNTSVRTFKCRYCSQILKTLSLRKKHETIHAGEVLKCNLCDIEFSSAKKYRWHQDSVQHQKNLNPSVKFRYKCEQCDYSTKAKEMLEAHVNRYHLQIAPYECAECGRRFTGAKPLAGHMLSHRGKQKQCEVCGKSLGGPSALKRHLRLHAPLTQPHLTLPLLTIPPPTQPSQTIPPLTQVSRALPARTLPPRVAKTESCPLCGKGFPSRSHMRAHVRQKHWRSKQRFDHTKLEGLSPEHYHLFYDRRRALLSL